MAELRQSGNTFNVPGTLGGSTDIAAATAGKILVEEPPISEDNDLETVLKHLGAGKAFLPDRGDSSKGLEILMEGADATWLLRTQSSSQRTLPSVQIPGDTAANYLTLKVPPELLGENAGNDWTLEVQAASDSGHPAQAASVFIPTSAQNEGITVTADEVGAGGNVLSIAVTTVYRTTYPTARWDGDVLRVTTSQNQRTDALVSVINAARRNNSQIVVASLRGASASDPVNWLSTRTFHLSGGVAAATSEPVSFQLGSGTTLTLRARTTSTLAEIKAAIADLEIHAAQVVSFGHYVTLTGDDSDTLQDAAVGTTLNFAGGALPTNLSISVDTTDKEVTIAYRDTTRFADLIALTPPDEIALALVRGTAPGDHPVAAGFQAVFDVHLDPPTQPGQPAPTTLPSGDSLPNIVGLGSIPNWALLDVKEEYNVRQYVDRGSRHIINPDHNNADTELLLARTVTLPRVPALYRRETYIHTHQRAYYGGLIRHLDGVWYLDDTWNNPHKFVLFARFKRVGNGGKMEVAFRSDLMQTYRQQLTVDGTVYGALDPAMTGDTEDLRTHRLTLFGLHAYAFDRSEAYDNDYIIGSDRHEQSQNLTEIVLSPTSRTITYDDVHYTIFEVPPDGPSTITISDQTDFSTGFSIRDLINYCRGLTNAQAQEVHFVEDNAPDHEDHRNKNYNPENAISDSNRKYPLSYTPTPNQTGGCFLVFLYNRSDPLPEQFPRTEFFLDVEYEYVQANRETPEARGYRLSDIHSRLPAL